MKFYVLVFSILLASTASAGLYHPKGQCDQSWSYTYYSLCYSYENRQALWTFHWLTKKSIKGTQKRTNNYRADRKNVDSPVGGRDYRGSGFDRGHLVPAGDMKLNRQAMSETFFMTNMSPQRSGFNSGVWRSLESAIRKMVLSYGNAYVITAPVLEAHVDYPKIKSQVSVPEAYYKIAYFPDKDLMVAYLIPNHSQKGKKYSRFQVTVDEIEALTHLDFFSELPDDYENALESNL